MYLKICAKQYIEATSHESIEIFFVKHKAYMERKLFCIKEVNNYIKFRGNNMIIKKFRINKVVLT